MAKSAFVISLQQQRHLASYGVSAKALRLAKAQRAGIAVPSAMVLLEEGWQTIRDLDLLATQQERLVPRDEALFIDALGLFTTLSGLTPRIAVRTLTDTDSPYPLAVQGIRATSLRVDRRDPAGLSRAICGVWSAIQQLDNRRRGDVLLMSMVEPQFAGMALVVRGFEDDWINYVAGVGDGLAHGAVTGMAMRLPRIYRWEQANAKLPFAQRLQQLLRQVRQVFGDHQWEIEWADDGERCWLMEIRPVLHAPRRNDHFGGGDWRESMPNLPSYFMAKLLQGTNADLLGYFRQFDAMLGDERQFVEMFAGRVRFNYSVLGDIMRRWGLPGSMVNDLNDAELVAISVSRLRIAKQLWRIVHLVWDVLVRPWQTTQRLRTLQQRLQRYNGELDELIMVLHESIVVTQHAYFALARVIGPIESWMRRQRLYAEWSSRYRSLNRRLMLDMVPIRRYLAAHPDIAEQLRRGEQPVDSTYLGMWEELLNRYGFRGLHEQDIATVRFREVSIPIVQNLLQATAMHTLVPHTLRGVLAWPIWLYLQHVMTMRDRLRTEQMRIFDRARRIIVHHAERAVERRYLDTLMDVWLLSPDEFVRVMNGWRVPTEMLELRKATQAEYAKLDAPATMYRFDDVLRWNATAHDMRTILEGRSINDGMVRGIVWRPAFAGATLPSGMDPQQTIVVLRTFDHTWVNTVQGCAGIVVEHGAELSHAAVLLRTLSQAAIIAVRGAHDTLPTGTAVVLVAGAGYIEKIGATPPLLTARGAVGALPDFGATHHIHTAGLVKRVRDS
jgi:phosphohistidine swiveling domain-containing protein